MLRMSPTTMRAVCAGLRGMFRSPILRIDAVEKCQSAYTDDDEQESDNDSDHDAIGVDTKYLFHSPVLLGCPRQLNSALGSFLQSVYKTNSTGERAFRASKWKNT